MDPTERYDQDAVAQILKRAAEIERDRRRGTAGLSVDDLEEVARESGIDPAAVRQAVAEHRAGSPSAPSSVPASSLVELRLAHEVGGELRQDDARELLSHVSPMLGLEGRIREEGRAHRWGTYRGPRRVALRVHPVGGGTRLEATESLGALAGALYGGLGGGLAGGGLGLSLGLGLGLLGSVPLALGGVASCLLLALGTAHFAFQRARAGRREELSRLVQALAAEAAEMIGRRSEGRAPERDPLAGPERSPGGTELGARERGGPDPRDEDDRGEDDRRRRGRRRRRRS